MSDQNTSMIESIGLHVHPFWKERVEKLYGWFHRSSKTSKDAWTWKEGQNTSKWSTTRGSSKRGQSVPVNPADRPNPEEKPLPWKDIGDLDTSKECLYPDIPFMEPCPVEKVDHLETEQQQPYMKWIKKIFDIHRSTSNDPRMYCAYCDMNNHLSLEILMQACIQAPESRCETSMYSMRRPSPSISMPHSTDQWWKCKAQLVQDRVQACKAGMQGT